MSNSNQGAASRRRHLIRVIAVGGLLSLGLAACGGGTSGDSGGGDTFTIGGWGGVLNDATKDNYVAGYQGDGGGEGLEFVFDDAPGAQQARVQAQQEAGAVEWDLIDSFAATHAHSLHAKGYLEPLPADLKQRLIDELGEDRVTDFGFTNSNTGHAVIVCNMDKVDVCPKDAGEFFDTETFPGTRTISGVAPLDAVTTAMIADGMDPADAPTAPIDMDRAFELLEQIRPSIRVFFQSGDQAEQVFRTGEVDMGMSYSGRVFNLLDEGMNLEFNWGGAIYEAGIIAVPKGADMKEEAFEFMEWIATHPEAQAGYAEQSNYSVANPEAFPLMDNELADRLIDTPKIFDQLTVPNYDWYVENEEELVSRFQQYTRNG